MKNAMLTLIGGFAVGCVLGTLFTTGADNDAVRFSIIAALAFVGRFA